MFYSKVFPIIFLIIFSVEFSFESAIPSFYIIISLPKSKIKPKKKFTENSFSSLEAMQPHEDEAVQRIKQIASSQNDWYSGRWYY